MLYETIQFERRGAGAWIFLNRPKQKNSISSQMLLELESALTECKSDQEIKAIVFTGKGDAFCAGADLKNVLSSIENPELGKRDFLDLFSDVGELIRTMPKPVIAAVNGLALAGGLELVMCCDIVYAVESAKIGDAHSNFGVFPGAGGAAVLPKKIGLNRAKHLLFSGEFLPAAELERFGLVNKVVADNELTEEVEKYVELLASKSPLVLRRMKEVANASMDQTQEAALRHEILNLRQHARSYDLAEGLKAFKEKRKPQFKGY
ncbi:enoyl-CoA hydratase/isomerase family protein [Bacillus sp. B15-48]|uniref:enoyl-CoA hydratase/isomerase family protein n=1 Tax=Bacillus sp. B15-48 TaxID=1548601 RepID=UPI00193FC8FC|nr:enoyl-CoA hydratase/isomerase family protein [Bacillus sp. B15-48]MBM4763779.1 enoyl-CoA hydratase/isomerase family protein [Bacillus sp. B15-48]